MTLSTFAPHPHPPPPRVKVIAAFAAVYLIWGSTYLAIRIGVETWPPFLMGGLRFLLASAALWIGLAIRGTPRPTPRQWRNGVVAGTVMLVGGNGLVNWAEIRVPSSTAALFIASAPVWFAVFDWLRPGGTRPRAWIWLGIGIGLGGVALLVWGRDRGTHTRAMDPAGILALGMATICWAGGSIFSRHSDRPASPWMGAAVQMLAAGIVMVLLSGALGELRGWNVHQVSSRSWGALAYLVAFGSWIGFSSYLWLLEVSTPARVSTYAYVNPVVAVFLGWLVLGERVTPRMAAAAVIILAAVVILTWPRPRSV